MTFQGDTLSTSWTPIDRASPSSKYPPSVSPSSKYPQGHSPSSKYPPGVSQTSQASWRHDQSSSGSTLAHGIEARQGSLRSGESGKYIPHLADWAGLVDISAHASESIKHNNKFLSHDIDSRVKTQSCSSPRPPLPSSTPAANSFLQRLLR